MTISKAHWDMEGEKLRLSMPFSKVDKERRIVSGFATLDNVDRQDDIVTSEASVDAFKRFRGNIREMHQPLAVGKMIGFKEDKYFDPETKKFYSGVYVSAYVSKGAQNTWEKVLDGTLSGFSIGGKMNKWDDAYDEKMDKPIRVIKEYDLVELSLVDTPANQFANILSVEKVNGADVLKGDLADVDIENVFWDSSNGIVSLSAEESAQSPVDGSEMKNIGFVEKNDNEKTNMIKFLVDSAKGINTIEIKKEVSPMNDTTNEVAPEAPAEDAVVEDAAVEESEVAPEADATTEDAVDKSYSEEKEKSMDEEKSVDEEKMEDEEETKSDDKKSEDAEKSEDADEDDEVSKSNQVVVDAVTEIQGTLTSAFSDLANTVKALHEQVSALSKSIDSVKNEVTEAKGQFNEFGKRVDAVEADTAFRKSGDLGEIVQETQLNKAEKSPWGGRFLKTADLFN